MSKIYESVDAMMGHTPMLACGKIKKYFDLKANLFLKMEMMNPGGSAKDRIAKKMLDEAEKKGLIKAGAVIIEPTSGNTGIGLAAVGAAKGYRVIIVMPETMSIERQRLMKAYGAELILTEGALGMSGAITRAEALASEIPGSFIPGQFDNSDNALAHYETTGPEIYADMKGAVDVFVAGVGTGGTITGTGRYLKEMKQEIQVVAVEPASSAVLSGKPAGAHGLQGIGAGFVPKVLDIGVYDQVIPVTDDEAYEMVRLMGRTEGILIGISGGAALSAAISLAKQDEYADKNIVVLMPDSGERYLSTGIFE